MPESSDRPGRYDQEQIIDSWDNKCLLNIPKTNCISCLLTTETSEPSANVVRTSRAEAVRGGYMSTEHPVIAWSSEIGIANFQIGVIFINKPQIWVLNNYILTWKTLKTTFHDTITVIFRKLHGFLGNDVSQVHKNRQERILRKGCCLCENIKL